MSRKILHTLSALVLFASLLFGTSSCTACKTEGHTPTAAAAAEDEPSKDEASQPAADGIVRPSDPGFRYVGRISFANPDAPRMGFTGAQIYANFTGTSVSMIMKPQSGFFVAVVDSGKPITVQSLKDSVVTIAKGLKPGTHSLAIYQSTEAPDVEFPVFYGLKLDPGAGLDKAPVLPTRKIEFIGNSITCGKGALDTTQKKNRDDIAFESWFLSYDAEVARRLNAQCMVVARSGIGIYRNNGDPKGGTEYTMQHFHQRTLFTIDSEMWDYSSYQPDLVCINLGTNDTAQSYDVQLLKKGALQFFGDVRQRYPKAKIVVLTGPMRSGQRLADQKAALDYAVNQLKAKGDKEIYRFDFPHDTGKYGYGTGMHPSTGEHKYMADLLTPYLQKLMNW